MAEDPDAEILIEIARVGAAIEVRATSASDGLEVSFSAPLSAAKSDLQRLARAKLTYVRAKQGGQGMSGAAGPAAAGDSGADPPPRTDGRGGIIV